MNEADRWNFSPGDFTTRTHLRYIHGCSPMGGIAPARRSTHVFLFHGPHREQWRTGWKQDGFYYYAGPAMKNSNGPRQAGTVHNAIESAWSKGRRLQVLESPGSGGLFRFVDTFQLDSIADELQAIGPDGQPVRHSLYRLRSIDNVTHQPGQLLPPGDARWIDVRRVERCDLLCQDARNESLDRERPETRLSKAFERYVMSQGYAVHRLGIRHTPDCKKTMLTDTWIAQLHLLTEAKAGKNPTDDVRMAVGQLFQYTRHTPDVLRKAILLPSKPDGELLAFTGDMRIDVIWPEADTWYTTGQWARLLGMKQLDPHQSDGTQMPASPAGILRRPLAGA